MTTLKPKPGLKEPAPTAVFVIHETDSGEPISWVDCVVEGVMVTWCELQMIDLNKVHHAFGMGERQDAME